MAKEDDFVTSTSQEQKKLTEVVGGLYKLTHNQLTGEEAIQLRRREHVAYLERGLDHMGPGYAVLDSSRPWLCYWILHSLALLGEPITPDVRNRCIDFLRRCQDVGGGYGGGPGQLPHLATTYAAVCALVTAGGPKALESIDRQKLLCFLVRMKAVTGGFHMHHDGEIDVRGSYCALAVAHMLSFTDERLTAGVGAYIATCQTYEGGIGGEAGVEAHGGYTFCGLAAAMFAHQSHLLHLPRLLSWLVFRQGAVEGGFQGRTNKLVDGCYSFWQGNTFKLMQRLMPNLLRQEGRMTAGIGGLGGESGEEREGECGGGGSARSGRGAAERHGSDCGRGRDSEDGEGEGESPGEDEGRGRKDGAGAAASQRDGGIDTQEGDGRGRAECVERSGASSGRRRLQEDAHGAALRTNPDGTTQASDLTSNALSVEQESGAERRGSVTVDGDEDRQSVESSEYETDDDEWGDIRTAADLFPCEPLDTSDGCSCAGIVIEDETEETRPGESGHGMERSSQDASDDVWEPLLNARALQAYILLCCQQADGGLRDKPGKARDYYHTCYCLSGLSMAQRCHAPSLEDLPRARHVVGPYSNLLEPADPLCNVHVERYAEAVAYFADRPIL